MEVRCRRYDYMDVIGRIESGTEIENNVWNSCRDAVNAGIKKDLSLTKSRRRKDISILKRAPSRAFFIAGNTYLKIVL
jgi:hypothetical protein